MRRVSVRSSPGTSLLGCRGARGTVSAPKEGGGSEAAGGAAGLGKARAAFPGGRRERRERAPSQRGGSPT